MSNLTKVTSQLNMTMLNQVYSFNLYI